MTISKTLMFGAALSVLGVVSCVSADQTSPDTADAETQPFIDPVTLSQSMCSGRSEQSAAAAAETAARLNPGFDYADPFELPLGRRALALTLVEAVHGAFGSMHRLSHQPVLRVAAGVAWQ